MYTCLCVWALRYYTLTHAQALERATKPRPTLIDDVFFTCVRLCVEIHTYSNRRLIQNRNISISRTKTTRSAVHFAVVPLYTLHTDIKQNAHNTR